MKRMIPLVLLTACGGNFVDNSPRCGHDVFDWFGGLVHHLDQGDGFSFNYVPPELSVARINGGYITENSNTDFYWYKTYADGYYLEKSTIQGIGTAYSSGDLDVLYVEDVVDSLEDTDKLNEEVMRECRVAGIAKVGDPVVIVCGTTYGRGATNQIKVEYLQNDPKQTYHRARMDDNNTEFNGCTIS